MHMADALLSPMVGGVMAAVSGGTMVYSAKKLGATTLDEKKIPLMGVMGAFVFAAQMVNFTIPGTGSSGHIGGGILLAALLGPYAAFLTLASVLLIQCLFFADGGLLAYGCNAFNLGVCACLIAYPLLFKPIVQKGYSPKRITVATIVSVVFGLQIGALLVVVETLASGVTELPFLPFLALMQPIHLAIGIVEGIVTASILCFVYRVRPELLEQSQKENGAKEMSLKKLTLMVFLSTILVAGGLSLFASTFPDGLEWSIQGVTGTTELDQEHGVYDVTGKVVDATAMMPGYGFAGEQEASKTGKATAGLIGSGLTVLIVSGIGWVIRSRRT